MKNSYKAMFGAAMSLTPAAGVAAELTNGMNINPQRDAAETAICEAHNITLGDSPAMTLHRDGTDIVASTNIGGMVLADIRFDSNADMMVIQNDETVEGFKLQSAVNQNMKFATFNSDILQTECKVTVFPQGEIKYGQTLDDFKASELYQSISCGGTNISISPKYNEAQLSIQGASIHVKQPNGDSWIDLFYCKKTMPLPTGPQ